MISQFRDLWGRSIYFRGAVAFTAASAVLLLTR